LIHLNVLIPLRGIGYEKRAFFGGVGGWIVGFPSPCGELVMKNSPLVLLCKLLLSEKAWLSFNSKFYSFSFLFLPKSGQSSNKSS
jgi:hypothetical protein